MWNKNSIIFTIIFIVLVLAVSGCTSSSDTSKFENEYISFEYPSSWTIKSDNGTDAKDGYIDIEARTEEGRQPFMFSIVSSSSEYADQFPASLDEWKKLVIKELGTVETPEKNR